MRSLSLLLTIFYFAGNLNAQNSVQKSIDALTTDPLMQNAGISFMVMDLNTKEVLASHNPKLSLSPASTMKLVTTATALEVLGPGYQYKTEVIAFGEIDSAGVLHGDIVIKGYGDPTLGSKYYEKQEFNPFFMQVWVDSIRAAGIRKITGRVIGDASYFSDNTLPGGWSWSDMGNYFGAGPCGLTVFDNMIRIGFNSGAVAGEKVSIGTTFPAVPDWNLDIHILSANGGGDNAYLYGAPYQNDYMGFGTIPKGQTGFEVKASLPDPAFVAACYLDSLLAKTGIDPAENPTTERRLRLAGTPLDITRKQDVLMVDKSPYLSSIVWWTNMVSVNLFAETLLNTIGAVRASDGSAWSGSASVERFWAGKGIDVTGLYVNDGSGLSRSNAISAHHYVDILKYMSASKNADTFKESLPVAGKSGTLSNWCKGGAASGNLMAKSGSMTRIKSHAGYVTTASGRKLAFALIINNYNATSAQLKLRIEAIFNTMAAYSG
jgi:D-alanyl-D-alanine carboxypeptidase/D-alanyl-D-alanine-endopeptidase (penicillin-binding protein 4)